MTQCNLGVSLSGQLSQDYEGVLSGRYDCAELTARRVFDSFAGLLMIQDLNYPSNETPHYAPMSSPGHPMGVYLNESDDMNNPRGQGSTFYHELGHMIDHAATGFQTNISGTYEFANALKEDGLTVLEVYQQASDEGKNNFISNIYRDCAHSCSDLLDAVTEGKLHGGYGHPREYWKCDGKLQAEAFAHFFEASMGGGQKLEMLQQLFPTAFGMFSDMLESLLGKSLTRRLRRPAMKSQA